MGHTWKVQYKKQDWQFSKFTKMFSFEKAQRIKARLEKTGHQCWMYDVAVY